MLRQMEQCEKVLMIPEVPILELENPYLRPEHEVDLTYVAQPPTPGKCSKAKSLQACIVCIWSMTCCLSRLTVLGYPRHQGAHRVLDDCIAAANCVGCAWDTCGMWKDKTV